MTLSSLSIYVVFVDPHQGNKDVMSFSLPTTKAYVQFLGNEKVRAYLQYIYCKVKQWIQRELSHTIKLRCACVWKYMVANLILLCSLTTYLSFETWKQMLESRGYLIHLFFSDGHLSTHCFRYLGHLSIFFNFLFFLFFLSLFFMNNFCITPCLFSAIKLWEKATRIWSIYLVDGKPNMFLCSPRV
jgi:hypothetical protein